MTYEFKIGMKVKCVDARGLKSGFKEGEECGRRMCTA